MPNDPNFFDDAGNESGPIFDGLGQPQSPVGFQPQAETPAPFTDPFSLGNQPTNFSSDAKQKKWKGKGYTFAKNGVIWNKDQSATVGSWDVKGWIDEQREDGKSDGEIGTALDEGITWDKNSDGSFTSRGRNSPQPAGTTNGGKAPTAAPRTVGTPSSGTPTPSRAPSATPTPAGNPQASAPDTIDAPSSFPGLGGGGGQTGGPLEISDISDPGRRSGADGVPPSLFDFLPPNFNQLGPEERMSALIGAVTRRQEAGLESGLGRIDQARDQQNDRAQGVRDLEDKILGDTDPFDENTIQALAGRQTQRGNQQANVLADALENRRANAGSARAGGAQTERSAILTGAANSAAASETDIRARAREANLGARNAALGAAGGSQRADAAINADLQGRAAGAIEGSQVFGDAFLTQNLLNRGATQQQPVFRTINAGGAVIRDRLA